MTSLRAALIQWEQKPFTDLHAFLHAFEGMVSAVQPLKPDLVVFPEHLSWSIATACDYPSAHTALEHLAGYTPTILAHAAELAHKYGLHLAAGSLPNKQGNGIFNTAFLCAPDKQVFSYDKIYLTPWEKAAGLVAGTIPTVWDTALGKLGIAICYDVEFPELIRKLARMGARLIVAPFQTDDVHGYWRVRYCAQARAIENECYLLLSGNVGQVVHNPVMDFNYAASAIVSPCDHFFPTAGIVRECLPGVPGVCIADLNFALLDQLHAEGSVRTLTDAEKIVKTNVDL